MIICFYITIERIYLYTKLFTYSPTKEATVAEIKDYFDNNDFDMNDVVKISRATTKEDELFDYAGVPSYLKISKKLYEKEKKDYEISL